MKIVKEHIDENLKDEFINQLMRISKSDDADYRAYLQTLSEEDLDEMLGDYYLWGIPIEKK